jgi:hypothetical protein
MIFGAHFLLYSSNPEADRAFLRDAIELKPVDIGGGWLIFALPPAEMAVHPGDGKFAQEHASHKMLGVLLYLMCDDLKATMKALEAKKPGCTTEVEEEDWGIRTTVRLPSGGEVGLYQPTHELALVKRG